MQVARNDHRQLWLLSGTGEGPGLASALIKCGWQVSVSVVTRDAATVYEELPLAALWIGPLVGVEGICRVLQEQRRQGEGFAWVVDATHPFAMVIRANLQRSCQKSSQPLIRFERPMESTAHQRLISSAGDLSRLDLGGSRLLLAIGARHLRQAVAAAEYAGAEVFARVLPSPDGLRQALSAGLPAEHVALLRPTLGENAGRLEAALCRRWGITMVLCRQSGGAIERLWQSICDQQGLKHFLIARPDPGLGMDLVHSLDELLIRVGSAQSAMSFPGSRDG